MLTTFLLNFEDSPYVGLLSSDFIIVVYSYNLLTKPATLLPYIYYTSDLVLYLCVLTKWCFSSDHWKMDDVDLAEQHGRILRSTFLCGVNCAG